MLNNVIKLRPYTGLDLMTLEPTKYLSDIIDDLYWKKEHYELYTVYSDDCLRD